MCDGRRHASLALLATLLLSAPQSPPSVQEDIQRQLRLYTEAFKARDVKALLGFYEEDAIRVVPGRTLRGREEIRAAFERVVRLEFKTLSIKFETEDIKVFGNVAQEVGVCTGEDERPGGEHVTWKARYLTLWHRSADGVWRVQSDATMFDPRPKSPPAP